MSRRYPELGLLVRLELAFDQRVLVRRELRVVLQALPVWRLEPLVRVLVQLRELLVVLVQELALVLVQVQLVVLLVALALVVLLAQLLPELHHRDVPLFCRRCIIMMFFYFSMLSIHST